jgi:hypothetical protein
MLNELNFPSPIPFFQSMLVHTADKIIGDAKPKDAANPIGEGLNPDSSLPAHDRLPGVLDCPPRGQ